MNYLKNDDFLELIQQFDISEKTEFLVIICSELEDRLSLLKKAIATRNLVLLEKVSHKIAGSMGVLGVKALRIHALNIENHALDNQFRLEDAEMLQQGLVTLMNEVRKIQGEEGV